MKFNKIKPILYTAALGCTLGLSSCIGDLDVTPIDPSVNQVFNQNEVFGKMYASLANTGQNGPAGNGDLDGIDEGTSGFFRLIWNFSELPTDEGLCSWGDVGIAEMNFASWSASHNQLEGLYYRLYFGVTLSNLFLEMTEGKTDDNSIKQRAEARFLRALNYYYLMDFYGDVPFTTVVSSEKAKQIDRADLFLFIEKELLDIIDDQYDALQAPYGRADKVATWLLLSRMYLNAEVYTGQARWADAVEYSEKVISSGYELADEYSQLFMGDNDLNANVMKEIILPIRQDGVLNPSYATSTFLIASTRTQGMGSWGSTEGWGGNRGRVSLAAKFFPNGEIPAGLDEVSKTIAEAGDDRAMFVNAGSYVDDKGETQTIEFTLPISNVNTFKEGVGVAKFTNIYSNGAPASNSQFVDMDMPFFRMAEAYLTYAEANLRNGGDVSKSLESINVLRQRANARELTDLTLNQILDEKSREFYFEGHRRTVLVRYGYFTSSTYLWDWKGGSEAGTGVSAIYNLLPIPTSDLIANGNLTQNPGY